MPAPAAAPPYAPPALPTGPNLSCRSWLTEAPYRMLLNNLDPAVAGAGIGRNVSAGGF